MAGPGRKSSFARTGSQTKELALLAELRISRASTRKLLVLLRNLASQFLSFQSKVTEATQGSIVKVSPTSLTTEFASIMADEIIATQVSVDIFLHHSLRFLNEKPEDLLANSTHLQKIVGNATPSSSFSFQCEARSREELKEMGVDMEAVQSVPLQALFRYSGLDGQKWMRAITKVLPVVKSKDQVVEEANVEVMARAGRRRAVKLAEEGRLEEAKQDAEMWRRKIREEAKESKAEVVMKFEEDAQEMAREIDMNIRNEEMRGNRGEAEKRRQNYNDALIVKMSEMRRKQ
jgi:hypothetical protein